MLAYSYARFGAASPPTPQSESIEANRQLWLGNILGSDGTIAHSRSALASDPAFPYRWSDLGDALASDPDSLEKARYCFRQARRLAPHDPQIALRAAHFHFRLGETETALQLGAEILRQTPDYDSVVFVSYLRMGGDLSGILQTGIADNPRAAGAFFRFLSGRPDPAAEDTAWVWLAARGYATHPLAELRAASLMKQNRAAEAAAVKRRFFPPRDANLLENSGFETPPTGAGFDWRIDPCNGVSTAVDAKLAHAGHASLRIRFEGADNTDFHHLWQPVWLEPGRYRLTASVRTEDLDSDEGLALAVTAGQIRAVTPALNGTRGWTRVDAELSLPSPARLARVEAIRRPSRKFQNRPKGAAWIDDVALERQP